MLQRDEPFELRREKLSVSSSNFELVFGRRTNLPTIFSGEKIDPVYNIDNYLKIIKYRMQKAHQLARQILVKMKNRNKLAYDEKLKRKENVL